jgi:RNA polymerase sigma factor (TIGR02999 family)
MLKNNEDSLEQVPLSPTGSDVTSLLVAWRSGDRDALDELMAVVYRQLHVLAASYMSRERPDHTLSATALVHEMYLKLLSADVHLQDRAHFLAVAASIMRRILIDRARGLQRIKRGSGAQKLSLVTLETTTVLLAQSDPEEVLYLDQALTRLEQQDMRKARLMEMVYFGGLNCDEAALVLDVSVATVNRDLKLAKAWLRHELRGVNSEAAAQA